jgi:hypothetical protein
MVDWFQTRATHSTTGFTPGTNTCTPNSCRACKVSEQVEKGSALGHIQEDRPSILK